jgi:hypothetical protein
MCHHVVQGWEDICIETDQNPVRFEVFMVVTVKNGVFWDVTASVVPSSLILVTLMKEALSSSETSVLTRATQHNIPQDAILQTEILCPADLI